jgi:hypothetical protein
MLSSARDPVPPALAQMLGLFTQMEVATAFLAATIKKEKEAKRHNCRPIAYPKW